MEAENKKKASSGKELWGEAEAQVEEEDEKADVRSWVEGGRSGRYQPGARRPIPGSVVTGESESEEPLGPAKWARMTRGRAAREVVMRRSLPVARLNPHHSLLLLPLDCLCAAVAPPLPSPPGHPRRRAPACCNQDHPTPARGLFPQRPTHPQRPSLPAPQLGNRKKSLTLYLDKSSSWRVDRDKGNRCGQDLPNRGLVTFLSVAHSSASSHLSRLSGSRMVQWRPCICTSHPPPASPMLNPWPSVLGTCLISALPGNVRMTTV